MKATRACPSEQQSVTCLLALSAVSPQLISRLPNLLRHTKTLDFNRRDCHSASAPYQLLPPRKPCSVASLLWTLNGGARRLHCFFLFFPLPSPQRTMTLKSNKNEPAVTLESVNSVRTALSDLYLEQLIQNKPKSDKVRCLFFLVIFLFTHSFRAPTAIYCLLACFRDSAMRHMTVVCFATRSLKIDFASVFTGKTHCK